MLCFLCGAKLAQPQQQQPPPAQDPREAAKQRAWWALGVLGLQQGASWTDVKSAHRKLLGQLHPDKKTGDEKRYKEVGTAYDILKTAYGEN